MKASPFDNVLLASIRALEDVVAPALDQGNPLASEQLLLVSKFLKFIRQRAAHSGDLAVAQFKASHALAQAVLPHVGECPLPLREELYDVLGQAGQLLSSVHAHEHQMNALNERLNAVVSGVVRCASELRGTSRESIERAVLDQSKLALDVQRAWLSPLGLDPEPMSIPDADSVIRGR